MQREIGRRLKLIRIACGYQTTREFAEQLSAARHIHEDSLGLYIRGERPIQMHDLMAIHAVTRYSTDWLLYGDPAALTERQRQALAQAEKVLSAEEENVRRRRRPGSL